MGNQYEFRMRQLYHQVLWVEIKSNGSMPCKMSHASIDAETRKSRNMPEDIIRLCVGIEDVKDLIRDLQNAVGPM